MTEFKNIALFAIFLVMAGMANSADWQEPWDSVKGKSIEACKSIFQDFQLQAICMDNEKKGYRDLQGDFGMPRDVASEAKERCERTFSGQFQLQAVCMKNEKEGYDKMSSY